MDTSVLAEINWLLIIIIGYLLLELISGWRQGFAERFLRTISTIASLVIMWVVAPGVKAALVESTDLDERMIEAVRNLLSQSQLPDRLMGQLAGVTLPESIQHVILNFGSADLDTLSAVLGDLMLSAVVFVALFVIAKILIEVLIRALNLVAKIPGLRGLNHIGGLLMAFLESFINIELFFLVLPSFSGFSFGMVLMDMVGRSEILTWLFENNVLMNIVSGLLNVVK